MSQKMRPDVVVRITYDFNAAPASRVRIATNARHEALDEILSSWLQDEVVMGRDDGRVRPADEVPEVVTVSIGLQIHEKGETWGFESNSGSRSLDVGIVGDVLSRLDVIPKGPLETAPSVP